MPHRPNKLYEAKITMTALVKVRAKDEEEAHKYMFENLHIDLIDIGGTSDEHPNTYIKDLETREFYVDDIWRVKNNAK